MQSIKQKNTLPILDFVFQHFILSQIEFIKLKFVKINRKLKSPGNHD
jgi:hypothetical protein